MSSTAANRPRDLLSPSLASDPRARGQARELRRIFTHDLYEVGLALYAAGWVTGWVHFKREELRIMIALPVPPAPTSAAGAWADCTVRALQAQGMGPFHLVLQAKLESGNALTLHDRAALKMAGVEVPRSAGRFKDLG